MVKRVLIALFICLNFVIAGCSVTGRYISKGDALRIARADAESVKAYGDLDISFNVVATLNGNEWMIDYNLKDSQADGGGPHYVIDAMTGKIKSKEYWQ